MKDSPEVLLKNRLDRRHLLRMGGLAGLGLMGGSVLTGCGGSGNGGLNGGGNQDANVLNFALNLEYLEAEYYLRGTTGAGLSAGDGGTATVTGGRKVTFSTALFEDYANEIAADELAHVRFLRSALGTSAVAEPNINFTDAFNAAAQAAGLGSSFDPFANETSFLLGAFVFEDVGVTAYHGAARLISNKDYLEAAAGILGTEAYHAGLVRTVLNAIGGSAVSAANAISDLRDSVDGGSDDDQGVAVGGHANVVPTDSNGIVYSRSTDQVLNIVYLNANKTKGGFFPNGLNGAIS